MVEEKESTILTFAEVEARLVAAIELWRRSPGGGRWPFASDAPWHLMTRETRLGDYDARGGDLEAPPPRMLPLSIAEVAMRDQASAWLALIDERDRRLVVLAVTELARGAQRVPWNKLRRAMGLMLGAGGLARRYERAIGGVCRAVNGGFPASCPVNGENQRA